MQDVSKQLIELDMESKRSWGFIMTADNAGRCARIDNTAFEAIGLY